MSDGRQQFDSEIERLSYELAQTNRRLTELAERVEQLEYVSDQLVTDLPTQTKSKHDKLGAILNSAFKNADDASPIAFVNQDMAAGAADCTKRHVRNLFQELDETYSWATYNADRRPAGLEMQFADRTIAEARDQLAEQFPNLGKNDA